MKTVFIIASFWPYRQGSKRVIGLAKNLETFGWKPVILTPPLYSKPDLPFTVIESPFLSFNPDNNIRQQITSRFSMMPDKLLTFAGSVANYPDAYKGWTESAFNAGCEVLQNQKLDAILSIWPITSHIVAQRLKQRFSIPWVADFPDLWSQNAYYVYGKLRKWFDKQLELRTIKSADVLITTSEPWAERLRYLHHKPTYSITHGFDPELMDKANVPLTKKFTITHTGLIYSGKRDPKKVLSALRTLIDCELVDPKDLELRFYGPHEYNLARDTKRYGLSSISHQYGIISHGESLMRQRESQVLLLLDWEDPEELGVYTGKIFEYLGSRRPILSTGGTSGNVIDQLLRKTNSGFHAVDTNQVFAHILVMYQEYKSRGNVHYHGDGNETNKYTHREMAHKVANVLDSLRR